MVKGIKVKVCLNPNCRDYRMGKNKTKWREDMHQCPSCGLILQKETIYGTTIHLVRD